MSDDLVLAELLAEAGLAPALSVKLARYGALLLETNRRFNVTGAESAEELLPHLLDSLTLLPYVQAPLLDVGSGGGLPAIPLALASDLGVTMVESTTKKAAFLEAAAASLGIHANVVPERAEVAARHADLREQFACVTARAVSSAPTVVELTLPFLRVGGIALLQRGRLEERERNAVMDAAPMLGGELEREVELEGDRRILVIRKVSPTPQRFPRRTGVPEKRPLCL